MKTLSRNLFWTAAVATSLLACACSKKAAEPAPTPAALTPVIAVKPASPAESGEGKLDPNDPRHGARKQMGLDVGVFVDGVQVSVLRSGDLPPMPSETLEGGSVRYNVVDYLKAIGVAPESIKSVHFHGNGDRIASVEGSELRASANKNRFQFQFLSGHTGAPVSRWDTGGLKNDFVVHEFRKVTIYVNKPSPLIDAKRQCHVGADGECSEAVPYATADAVKGTRVYVDGKMVGFVKRRQLADALVVGKTAEGDPKYSIAKLAAQMGVDTTGVKAVELVAGDDVIARASGEQFSTVSPDFYFTLPKHSHGKVRARVPAVLQAKEAGHASSDRDALISSLQIFKTIKPADRSLIAISEDTDLSVQLASNTARDLDSDRADQARGRGDQ